MAASTYFAQVQQLYIAYFGRPADTIGQAYWANQIDAANGSIASVIAGFSASAESAALFGNKSSIDKVTAIYQNAFGRAPEPAGLAYWVAQLDSGKVSQAQASWTIQQSAGAGDAAAVQNKLTAAQAFTAQIDTTAEITGYQGAAAAESARAFLKTVTADNATATAAVTGAAAAVVAATAVGVVGATYTLTAGVDNLVGTANADTFVAVSDGAAASTLRTLSGGDAIDGGAGVDTLKVIVTNNGAATATPLTGVAITNVEKLSIQNVSGAATAVNVLPIAGVTSVSSLNSSDIVNFTGLATGTEVLVSGSAQVGAVNFAQATATDAVKVTLNGGVNDVAVSASAGTATSAAINSTGGANGAVAVDTIKLTGVAGSLTTLAVNADSSLRANLTGTDFAAAGAALTVTGSAAVNLGNLGVFKTIDGSANAAGLTVGLSSVTSSFKGGAGADSVTAAAGAVIAGTATIDGGAGIDSVAASLINVGNSAAFKNFELLDLTSTTNGGSLDAALLTGSTITGVTINGSVGAAFALSNLVETTTGFNVGVTGDNGAAALTLGFAAASVAGTADVLNYTFGGTTAGNLGAGTITSTGIETINIASKGAAGVAINNSITVVDNTAKSIVITGDHALALTVAAQTGTTGASQLTSIDGSAATAGLTIVTAAPTVVSESALTIKGGSGVDSITVATSAIAGSSGAIVTTGAGNDTVNVAGATVTANTVQQFTTITDFTKGDVLAFGTAASFQTTKVDVAAATSLLAAQTLAANAVGAGATANAVTWFNYGADTYVVNNDGTAGVGADDIIVKLAGTLDLSHATLAANAVTFA